MCILRSAVIHCDGPMLFLLSHPPASVTGNLKCRRSRFVTTLATFLFAKTLDELRIASQCKARGMLLGLIALTFQSHHSPVASFNRRHCAFFILLRCGSSESSSPHALARSGVTWVTLPICFRAACGDTTQGNCIVAVPLVILCIYE